jgi:competence protein ComEC
MSGDVLVAIASRRDALVEDCGAATIVVSAVPARGSCVGPKLIIDRFDVSRNGAYAVWLGEKMRVETVQGNRGERPWSEVPWNSHGKTRKLNSGG